MANALRTKALDVKEHGEKQIRELQEAYGESMLPMRVLKKSKPAGERREMMAVFSSASSAYMRCGL